MNLNYERAGVSIRANDRFVSMIKDLVEKTWKGSGIQMERFASQNWIPYNWIVFGSETAACSVDGVGTKTEIASLMGVYDTIGIDAVAMSALDVYASGAIPNLLCDYLVVKKLNPDLHIKIIEGLVKGCLLSGCKLVGGETAEHPFGWLPQNYFDIATFCVGYKSGFDLSGPNVGMKIYGWLSYGLGSNGYSLVRKIFHLDKTRGLKTLNSFIGEMGCTLGEALLCPTKIYIQEIETIRKDKTHKTIMQVPYAHITGGGLIGNIPRILRRDCKVILDRSKWQRPPIFKFIQEKGRVSESEMDIVFNQGIQIVSVVSQGEINHKDCRLIGVVERRKAKEPQVQFIGKFQE